MNCFRELFPWFVFATVNHPVFVCRVCGELIQSVDQYSTVVKFSCVYVYSVYRRTWIYVPIRSSISFTVTNLRGFFVFINIYLYLLITV